MKKKIVFYILITSFSIAKDGDGGGLFQILPSYSNELRETLININKKIESSYWYNNIDMIKEHQDYIFNMSNDVLKNGKNGLFSVKENKWVIKVNTGIKEVNINYDVLKYKALDMEIKQEANRFFFESFDVELAKIKVIKKFQGATGPFLIEDFKISID